MSQKTFPHENLEIIKSAATKLSPWAHLATVGKDNRPDVVPVHPCWEGDVLWVLVGNASVKSKNIAHNNHVAFHWQVTESGDGVEVWGTATLHSDVETKKHLWNGVFDYDLNAFAPGGPENSLDTGFMRIEPYRAVYLPQYGMGGRTEWRKA